MKSIGLIGLSILFMIWLWLAWILLNNGGINLKNLIILAISATLIFVPLCRKIFVGKNNGNK